MEINKIYEGDALSVLKTFPEKIFNTCVTSPPYYALRDYGVAGQIGREETPELFIQKLVDVFREVRRTLRDDGTIWINMGDSYANRNMSGLKPKDLMGMPWALAFALRNDGWYLRKDIIWSKKNPMPESVNDRPTNSHEYIFLLSKAPKYYYDIESTLEEISENTHLRISQDIAKQIGSFRANGGTKTNGPMKTVIRTPKQVNSGSGIKNNDSFNNATCLPVLKRNKRSVWEITTKPYFEAHFATYPPELIVPCIKAGCPEGGLVLDPFGGANTTGVVSRKLNRNYVAIELNPEYIKIGEKREYKEIGLFK